jgi:hypothetical protein
MGIGVVKENAESQKRRTAQMTQKGAWEYWPWGVELTLQGVSTVFAAVMGTSGNCGP